MSLSVLSDVLERAPDFERLRTSMGQSKAHIRLQVLPNGVPLTVASLARNVDVPVLLVVPRPDEARRLYEQVCLWSADERSVLHFPESETLPFERLVTDTDTEQQRIGVLARLLALDSPDSDTASVANVIIASASAISQKTISREGFEKSLHRLVPGQTLDLRELLDQWRRMGYAFEPTVDLPGTAGRRGGILDIFPVGAEFPARIDLWGDEIDSIRLFDPATQRSTELVEAIDILPAQETLPGLTHPDHVDHLMRSIDVHNCNAETRERIGEEIHRLLDGDEVEDANFYAGFFNHGSLLDYLPNDAIVVRYRPPDIVEAAWETEERAHELREAKQSRGELPHNFPSSHAPWRETEPMLEEFPRRIDVTPWGAEDLVHRDAIVIPFGSGPEYGGDVETFVIESENAAEEGDRLVAVSSVPKRLGEFFDRSGVDADLLDALEETPRPGTITVLQNPGSGLSEGLTLRIGGRSLIVLSDAEIFGTAKRRPASRRRARRRDSLLSELNPGDYVVHVEHGVGRFAGTGRTPREDDDREYLIINYAEGDELYVPMEHLDRVTPYVAPLDRPPSLSRLGTQEWKRTKARVERSTREMAAELLSLYASRELSEGHSFALDTPWQVQLEDAFPYEETPDQAEAILDMKRDMESVRPMDRLICGDVGYGKTEVALRAAFKAVTDGLQVAILVPTTVLAQQHFTTFSERLKPYPVRVEVLSRFRTDREQRDIVRDLAEGKVDIVIGTHRLVQKDVSFKKLGLVVVDEEQRFGVAHKERLKQMRSEVDVLTMTATPIPRTLHLSLSGIRDMSAIQTAPEERLPIKTYVSEFSDELIREAIRREIDRRGQVYFLHNRVYNIDYIAGYIRRLVPEAKVGVAHGQMGENRLEQAMVDFADGGVDVLVCTTIIESGLDISNVNTLIVNRADTFGLAQLYQLRGRVGRSARRAYAYLLIPQHRSLTETAEKRLKTMLAATELGAGFQIAMKDLEIRGAGNILGANQSGHIYAVGFDLYTRLLSDAVESLRAQRASSPILPQPEEGPGNGSSHPSPAEGRTNDLSHPSPAGGRTKEGGLLQPPVSTTQVDIGIPANIPTDYVSDLPTRLDVYRRLVSSATPDDVNAMGDELVDRFGTLPWQVQNLLYVTKLKLAAAQANVLAVNRENHTIVLRLSDSVGGARQALRRHLGDHVDIGNTLVRVDISGASNGWEPSLLDTVERLGQFTEQMVAQLAAVP